jgi:hypothetical protein
MITIESGVSSRPPSHVVDRAGAPEIEPVELLDQRVRGATIVEF